MLRVRAQIIPPQGRSRQAAVGVLAAAALLAGCGAGAYTKRDFIARADAICSSALREARAIAPGSLTQYAASVLPVVQSESTQLHSLRRPASGTGDRATLARYYAALDQEVQEYRQLAAAARSGDQQGVASAEAALRASPAGSLAAGYGLSSCGSAGATYP